MTLTHYDLVAILLVIYIPRVAAHALRFAIELRSERASKCENI